MLIWDKLICMSNYMLIFLEFKKKKITYCGAFRGGPVAGVEGRRLLDQQFIFTGKISLLLSPGIRMYLFECHVLHDYN